MHFDWDLRQNDLEFFQKENFCFQRIGEGNEEFIRNNFVPLVKVKRKGKESWNQSKNSRFISED